MHTQNTENNSLLIDDHNRYLIYNKFLRLSKWQNNNQISTKRLDETFQLSVNKWKYDKNFKLESSFQM